MLNIEAATYDTLTSLPLFMGMGAQELTVMLERVNFNRITLSANQRFIAQGDSCQHLVLLTQGTMTVVTTSPLNDWTLTETIQAPAVLEPEVLQGRQRCYQSSYRAETSCQLLQVQKEQVSQTLMHIPVWRINFLNIISSMAACRLQMLTPAPAPTVDENIRLLLLRMCRTTKGKHTLHISQTRLGEYLATGRKSISPALKRLQKAGIINYCRQNITIET